MFGYNSFNKAVFVFLSTPYFLVIFLYVGLIAIPQLPLPEQVVQLES